jgi:DNA-binding transcriptional LysR family regulator
LNSSHQWLARTSTLCSPSQERSFTRAAAQIGVSPSALLHTIRVLEERLGLDF